MNPNFLTLIVVLLLVLIVVAGYNMYQENQYRKKIRRQFGHADQDVLMEVKTASVRDGQFFGADTGEKLHRAPIQTSAIPSLFDEHIAPQQPESEQNTIVSVEDANKMQPEPSHHEVAELIEVTEASSFRRLEHQDTAEAETIEDHIVINAAETPDFELTAPDATALKYEKRFTESSDKRRTLLDLNDLACTDLQWFDKRFDYMAYIGLYEAKELQVVPRLSGKHRFQMVACTLDGRFQAAEPIPGVAYQAFVIGLQSISRNGLVAIDELRHFAAQVHQFAEKMDGRAAVEDPTEFLAQAVKLDELCARVDQTIAIHLVSRTGVLGVELRQALERYGFALQTDGTFTYAAENGDTRYSIVALDGSAFTEALLSSQAYKGFSMLFDITRVPTGEKNFNQFMSLAVKLSGDLNLDLVDDQIQPLSTEWLKEVRDYIGTLQREMESMGIEPASPLAKRLFM
ncbi:MAG: cell division protein ZipA C-terminal FtsZ-binding domain-containing protein [Alysiella sp.]|uniref:cell division protein ZipA C-terminal FtsZ-binding domain-containing protein n=1 Tax=Alysiella sp. TaxID=1872483 RepID=UPI0026DD38AD|nr:cell division protein ZipA C-terminal FtsZ-binding domain-containing protein [Alysiella sp.]MDO4433697.1 cell division protein ZipA C-terminal FtsZ-binding domain-containing protein [Alysiella sp.]